MCKMDKKMVLNDEEALAVRAYFRGNGLLIQEALPDFNPLEREFVKTGYCSKCQQIIFSTSWTSKRIMEVENHE